MSEIIAHHTGRPVEQVAQDIDRDHYMTAEEARDYGIIDDIILPRRGVAAPAASGIAVPKAAQESELQMASA
jgi:ATP-dependent protease ClpP protease subunit